MQLQKIFDSLIQPGHDLWDKNRKNQISILISHLQDFRDITINYSNSLNNLPASTSNAEVWRNFKKYCSNILNWSVIIPKIAEQNIVAESWAEWQLHLREISKDVPEFLEFPLQNLSIKNPDDKNIVYILWKSSSRFRLKQAELNNRIINHLRALIRRPPKNTKIFKRSFQLHLFIDHLIGVGFADALLTEWQIFLQESAKLLSEIHHFTEDLKNSLLQPEELSKSGQEAEHSLIHNHREGVQDLIKNIKNQMSELENNTIDSSHRFENTWQDITGSALQKWEFRGTPFIKAKEANSKALAKKWHHLEKTITITNESWKNHLISEMEDWRKDLELSILQAETALQCHKCDSVITEKIHAKYIPHFEETIKIIDQSQEKFTQLKKAKKSQIGQQIMVENSHLLKLLRQQKLPRIVDDIRIANIEAEFQTFLNQIRESVERLSDTHIIFKHQDIDHLIPRSRNDHIALKNLVFDEYFSKIKSRYDKSYSEIQERVGSIVRQVTETDQIVEFNLEAAYNLLQEESNKDSIQASQLVTDGLERTRQHVEGLVDQSKEILEFIRKELWEITYQFESDIQNLGDNQKIIELKVRLAKIKTREELRSKVRKVVLAIRQIIPVLYRNLKSGWKYAQENYFRFQKLTGLTSQTGTMEDELSQFLTETNKRIQALPYVYQRLFRPEPLQDERFFSGRSREMDELTNQFESWKKGNYAVTAIVGERGSGKTTLLNFAEGEYYGGFKLHKFDFNQRITNSSEWLNELKAVLNLPQISTYEELEQHIVSEAGKQIFILENLQYLFIRSVQGFKALERFLLFISRTNDYVYWLITCTIYSWNYLDKVIHLSKYFSRIIFLENLPLEEVEDIILKRHRVSGYRLKFSLPEEISNSRKYRKLSGEQEKQVYIQENFFKDLNDFSSGNITITLLFWLRAIQEVTREQIVVNPLINFDFSFLAQLPSEELFSLAAFMQHEILDEQHFSLIFRQNPEKSSLLLSRLYNGGILLKNPRGFFIHPFIYRAVVRTLKLKNILH